MIELYQKLIDELKKEKACYARLLSLTLEQKQFLISGDVDKVAENLWKQEKEVFALSPLSGERNDLLAALGKAHRLSKATLAQVLQKAPLEIVEELKTAVIELVHSARKLETVNQGNEKLAHNALALADMTLKALMGKGRPQSNSPSAKNVEAGPSFVNRVV
jgi:restriction endonuclease